MSLRNRPKSQLLFEKACQLIPHGVNSPVRAFKGLGQLPLVIDSGMGDLITDLDGHSYIDYCGSWGALIHGHAHPSILESVSRRLNKGSSFGILSAVEAELASKVTELVPSIERVRFVSSGTEATMSAVRLARAFTGRDLIVKFAGHYHGHADFFLVQAGSGLFGLTPQSSSAGIPSAIVQHTICLPFNQIEQVKTALNSPEYKERIAAVIVEPIAANMGVVPATSAFLSMLKEETKKIGALLIFDEVVTGFRVAKGGAQSLYQIAPDLTCLGKIVGGGFPAAAFGGRREIMELLAPKGPVYQAGTLSGNPLAMEAGLKALQLLEEPSIYEKLESLTRLVADPVAEALKQSGSQACLQRVGSMFTLFFGRSQVSQAEDAHLLDTERFAHFFRYLFERGVYAPPSQFEAWFISTVHSEKHLLQTRDLILEYISTHLTSESSCAQSVH